MQLCFSHRHMELAQVLSIDGTRFGAGAVVVGVTYLSKRHHDGCHQEGRELLCEPSAVEDLLQRLH